jgi:hypothetical protein
MKECPRCRLVNPATAEMCDCGYSFQTGTVYFVCPNCRATEGLRPAGGGTDTGTKLLLGMLGGGLAEAYSQQPNQYQCDRFHHTFLWKPPSPRRRVGRLNTPINLNSRTSTVLFAVGIIVVALVLGYLLFVP